MNIFLSKNSTVSFATVEICSFSTESFIFKVFSLFVESSTVLIYSSVDKLTSVLYSSSRLLDKLSLSVLSSLVSSFSSVDTLVSVFSFIESSELVSSVGKLGS